MQPKVDYCSQLWSPGDQESINKLESVQRHFTSKVEGLQNVGYWDRLKQMKLYSQERRRERYMIIFLWKVSQGLVNGYQVSFSCSDRRGRTAIPKPVIRSSSAKVRQARESSLGVKGAKIFNLLPAGLRNLNSDHVDRFKANLDAYLSDVPDQPTISGQARAAESNSLIHQIPMLQQKSGY